MNHTYKLQENRIGEIIKKTIIFIFLIFFISLEVVTIFKYFTAGQQNVHNVLPVVIPIMFGIALLMSIIIGLALKKTLLSFRLIINDFEIRKELRNNPPIVIPFTQLTKIEKKLDGEIIIKSNSKEIIVFEQVENAADLEKVINNIFPVTKVNKKSNLDKYIKQTGIALIILLPLVIYLIFK